MMGSAGPTGPVGPQGPDGPVGPTDPGSGLLADIFFNVAQYESGDPLFVSPWGGATFDENTFYGQGSSVTGPPFPLRQATSFGHDNTTRLFGVQVGARIRNLDSDPIPDPGVLVGYDITMPDGGFSTIVGARAVVPLAAGQDAGLLTVAGFKAGALYSQSVFLGAFSGANSGYNTVIPEMTLVGRNTNITTTLGNTFTNITIIAENGVPTFTATLATEDELTFGPSLALAGGVSMNYQSNGQVGPSSVSSRRFKTDVRPWSLGTDEYMRLRPATFLAVGTMDVGVRALGMIAEETEPVVPEVVVTNDRGDPWTISYDLLAAVNVDQIQQLHGALAARRARRHALEATVAALKQRVAG